MDEQLASKASESNLPKYYQTVEGVALMILMMGPDAGASILKSFSHEDVTNITRAMSKIEDVSVPAATAGIAGFFKDLRQHSGIVAGTRTNIADLLENALGGGLARDLVSEIYGDDIGLTAGRLEWIPADLLARELQGEHVDLQAMLIAHIKPKHAADVLKYYPEDVAHKVMYSVSRKTMITSTQVDTLLSLIKRIESNYLETRSKTLDGNGAVAGILNRFGGNKAAFFEYVRDLDAPAGDEIEERMVDFFTIFNQTIETLELINEVVSIEQWALALKGADDEHRDFIMGAMPTRLAGDLKTEMVRLGGVPAASVESARAEIMAEVRKMNNEGTISLSFDAENMVV
ncbi:FliG C-terminal domain-containing protein [Vibrio owensii]|uniref:FliG C-terminal domain-containing protein n=1 Tax=Vibrio owensii TaxID=696485 RepID=UPI0018F1E093|nr:FliG C-terminal domain-containing protein [Vibrio owensii]